MEKVPDYLESLLKRCNRIIDPTWHLLGIEGLKYKHRTYKQISNSKNVVILKNASIGGYKCGKVSVYENVFTGEYYVYSYPTIKLSKEWVLNEDSDELSVVLDKNLSTKLEDVKAAYTYKINLSEYFSKNIKAALTVIHESEKFSFMRKKFFHELYGPFSFDQIISVIDGKFSFLE